MAKWMPKRAPGAPRTKTLASYKTLFGTGAFNCYLLMLVGGLAGIAVFEACSGVLMGAVLGLNSMAVSYSVYSTDPGGVLRRVVRWPSR